MIVPVAIAVMILISWIMGLQMALEDKRFSPFNYKYQKGETVWNAKGFSAREHFGLMFGDPLILTSVMALIFSHYRSWSSAALLSATAAGLLFTIQYHLTKPRRIEVPGALYDPGEVMVVYSFGDKTITMDPTRRGLRPAAIPHMALMAIVAYGLTLFYGWTAKQVVTLGDGHFTLQGVPHWQLLLITALLSIFVPTCIVGPDKHYYRDGKARLGAKLTLLLIPYLWFLCWYMW